MTLKNHEQSHKRAQRTPNQKLTRRRTQCQATRAQPDDMVCLRATGEQLHPQEGDPGMPKLRINRAEIYYEDVGSGPQTIVFAHGLLWSCRMFDGQVAALKDCYRCVSFDFRGQGQSEVTRDGYDMDTLYEDAAALIETLNLAPCHFA